MQSERVAAALVLAACVTPAVASQPQQPGFFASTDYGHASAKGGGDANEWGIGLGGEMPVFHSGFHFQLDGAYTSFSGTGDSVKTWNADAAPYYAWNFGRAGVSIHYIGQQGGYGAVDDTLYSYSAYGEWWAGSHFTLGIKSGTVTNGSGGSGSIVGGRLAAYLFPDLALSGTIEYEKTGDTSETDSTLEAEYLVSESLPLSVFGGYTLASPSGIGSTDINLFFIGVKIYANGHGEHTLVDRQRSGTLGWLASYGTTNF